MDSSASTHSHSKRVRQSSWFWNSALRLRPPSLSEAEGRAASLWNDGSSSGQAANLLEDESLRYPRAGEPAPHHVPYGVLPRFSYHLTLPVEAPTQTISRRPSYC